MSLILEALKKSEAERQRGQAPGLFVEQAPLARARREGAPAWAFALGALLLVVLAVFGWREWQRVDVVTPSPQPSPVSGRGSEAAVLPLPSVGEGRGEGAVVRAEPPAPVPMPSPQPSPASGRGSSEAAAPTLPPERSEAAVPPLPPAGEGRGEGSIPRLADLAAGERAALPPLKLTMHVFADDPAARFVILDGRRLGEGAMVADGVVLRGIDRDGVVIEAQGRALRLPRP
ncbi:general secretion pathway protein GspB [Arenimonas sp.]|uniref:general secretion pathway protein GspB n=1 Tax=Arenimonas sp. TaxID=1872635 RepID=UPI0025F6347C|nr:general secretion pathway protein GspB [Arenimonas sp.]